MGIGISFKKETQKKRFDYCLKSQVTNEEKYDDDDLEDAVNLAMSM